MSPANPRATGTVDFFDRFTGRGQVIGPDHRAYWLHRKELSGISELHTGQPVEFTPTETPRGPRALAVRPCEGAPVTR
jgi:cold shock CspA family protein